MTEAPRCPSCGLPVQSDWNTCPYCRAGLASAVPVVSPPRRRPVPAEVEGRRDQSLVGGGLLAFGILGFVGVLATLLSAPSETTLVGGLLVGGAAILAVLIGTVVLARRKSTGASAAVSLLGWALTAVMGVVLGIVLVLAFVIYTVNSCLNSISGKPAQN